MALSVEDNLFYLQAAEMLENDWAQAHNQELKRDQDIVGVREGVSAAEFQPSNFAARSAETLTVTHPGCSHLGPGGMPPSTQLNAPAKKRGRPAIKENAPPPSSANASDAAIKQKKPRSKAASIPAALSERPITASPPTVVVRVANAKNFSSASVLMPTQALRVDSSVVQASSFHAAAPPAVPCTNTSTSTQLVNRSGAPVMPGHSWPDTLYCGRLLGQSVSPGAFTHSKLPRRVCQIDTDYFRIGRSMWPHKRTAVPRLQVFISCWRTTSNFGVQWTPRHVFLRFQLFVSVDAVTLLRCVQIQNRQW